MQETIQEPLFGNYARGFAGDYIGNYSRDFVGNYSRTSTRDSLVTFYRYKWNSLQ